MESDRTVVKPDHTTSFQAPKSVPFVELHDGRLQGVVASSSSNERVYVSYVEADSGDFYCRTNNNRRCGGLRDHGCKHIRRLVDEGMERLPPEAVREYLGLNSHADVTSLSEILNELDGEENQGEDSQIFTRFQHYLEDLEREGGPKPRPGMAWFVS
jgi:hypothetical protein